MVPPLKKTFRGVSPGRIIQALKSLGYYQDAKGAWRRGRFHATLEVKRRRVTLRLHMDVYVYPEIQQVLMSRHRAVHKGRQVTEELNRILACMH